MEREAQLQGQRSARHCCRDSWLGQVCTAADTVEWERDVLLLRQWSVKQYCRDRDRHALPQGQQSGRRMHCCWDSGLQGTAAGRVDWDRDALLLEQWTGGTL